MNSQDSMTYRRFDNHYYFNLANTKDKKKQIFDPISGFRAQFLQIQVTDNQAFFTIYKFSSTI